MIREALEQKLGAYLREERQETRVERRKMRNEARRMSLQSPVIDGLPKGTVRSGLDDYAVMQEELDEELAEIRARKKKAYRFILKVVGMIDQENEKAVVELKYLHGMTFKEIGVQMGYTRSNAYGVHKRALEKVCAKLNNVVQH